MRGAGGRPVPGRWLSQITIRLLGAARRRGRPYGRGRGDLPVT